MKIMVNSLPISMFKTVCIAVLIFCAPLSAQTDFEIKQEASSISFNKLFDFATGLVDQYQSFSDDDDIANITNKDSNTKDGLLLLGIGFSNVSSAGGLGTQALSEAGEDDDTPAQVIGEALVFPNPFRQSSTEGGRLGYELSKDMNTEIHVYNMLGKLIIKRMFEPGAKGGRKGYNGLRINNETFDEGYKLSAGVYFFLIINDGNVLSRGKMAVKP